MQRATVPPLAFEPYLRHMTLVIGTTCLAVFCGGLQAAETPERTVAVLLSEPGGLYREYFDALSLSLEQGAFGNNLGNTPGKRPRVVELTQGQPTQGQPAGRGRPDDASLAGASVIVAVGVQAMRAAATWESAPPVLNVLVPRASHEKLLAEMGGAKRRGQISAIYLDQPPARQLNLIRQVLPGKRRVAALLGPDSSLLLAPLRSAFQRSGLELAVDEIGAEPEIGPALSRLMGGADVFLALPDSLIFTRDTARSVLMAAYRHQRPLIGFSQAYVTAGALAATFSTPEQIARQSADLLIALPPGRVTLPAPGYPEYFSVAVNRSVARALGLDIPADSSLLEALAAMPESRQ